jgi:DNA polymerase elongation subunit (family B)
LLEFEKVYKPLVLLKKKRYFGLMHAEGKLDKPYADYKGIELKRRDGATITKTWQRDLMTKILFDNDLESVRSYIAAGMRSIYLGEVPLDQFVMSAKLAKHPDNYKVQGAAVKLAVKQMKDSSLQIRVGDRVPYCIRSGYKGEKSSDRAVAPGDIASGKYTIDIDYYVQRAIRKPLISFLKHCLPDIESLFVTHCRKIDCKAGIKRLFPAATLTQRSKKRARIVRNPKSKTAVKATSISDFFK